MKKAIKIVGVVLALVVAAIVVLVATSDQSPEGRLSHQFPFDVQPGGTGPYLRVDMALDGCTMTLSANQYSAQDQIIKGRTMTVHLGAVAPDSLEYKPGYVLGKMQEGKFATCANHDGSNCSDPQPTEIQINLPRIAGTGKGEQYLGYVRDLVMQCQS